MSQYFVRDHTVAGFQGPHSLDEVRTLIGSGHISAECELLVAAGQSEAVLRRSTDWQRASTLLEATGESAKAAALALCCPKCNGEMVLGFVMDFAHHGSRLVSNWAEGSPIKSFWTGGVKLPEEKLLPIGTFRCSVCGFLESYARNEFAAR